MAIDDKLKVTRNQLAEFIDNHDTIKQFERLFDYINTFVIPDENTSNCQIEKYDTGWVANSDWTNAQFTVTHGLGADLSSLIVKFLISTDGTDANSFEPLNASGGGSNSAVMPYAVDSNNILFQTSAVGILYAISGTGVLALIDTESWYYRVVVTKLTVLT
jgi:hypothetical protein